MSGVPEIDIRADLVDLYVRPSVLTDLERSRFVICLASAVGANTVVHIVICSFSCSANVITSVLSMLSEHLSLKTQHPAFVLDVHSRMIVGWQIATHLRTELV
jgi:transposase InsO family protein